VLVHFARIDTDFLEPALEAPERVERASNGLVVAPTEADVLDVGAEQRVQILFGSYVTP